MKIAIQSLKVVGGELVLSPTPSSKHLIYSLVDEFKRSDKPYVADIDVIKKKRSLNSNNYAWHLVGEIGNILRKSKEEVYLQMLKDYGQSVVVSVVEQAESSFKKTIKYYEDFGESIHNGKLFKHIKVYIGSSEMDSKQMSILVSGIVDECKNLDIETLTPEQISLMNSRWTP
jgi:hypothetical protein